ncbi:MAG: hypothetical protein HEQ32_04800 [Vampirovibrio sp.]
MSTLPKNLFQENLPELEPTQHQTLINLAKQNPSGHIKIVTTNFDTLFTKALAGDDTIREFYAPRLPIPRSPKDYPSSITYLHGGVDKQNPEPKWVYSTSEFGKAYIADGWASRFVTELARNYYICFIGYSMNDPIMRYIFAGIKAVNEEHPDNVSKPLYIFQEQKKSEPKSPYEEEEESQELESLGLTPISFPSSLPKYSAMWQMLNEWYELQNRDIIELCQETFQDFDESKETLTDLQRYVLQNLVPPADLYFGEDNPLNGKSYQRAFINSNLFEHLATLPFGLLKAVQMVNTIQQRTEDERQKLPNVYYEKIKDLPNLIHPDYKPDQKNYSSYYSSYGHLISDSYFIKHLHPISEVWIRLIGKHMNDPDVFQWLIQQGDFLHSSLISELVRRLRPDTESLIAPDLKEAWELLLLNQNLLPRMSVESSFFIEAKMAKEGYSLEVKLWLEKVLSPYLKFYPPYSFGSDSSLYRAEVLIGNEYTKDNIEKLLGATDPPFYKDLSHFYKDLLAILESRLETYIELTKKSSTTLAGNYFDFASEVTSILNHPQNEEFDSRPLLIPLFQQCFDQLHETERALCNQVLARWASKPEWLWHRMVLAYVTQYPTLEPAPAWQILRQNDYLAIKKVWRIKQEFFECLEKEGLTLPEDILQAIYAQLRLDYDKKNESTWHDGEKYSVLESLKNNKKLKLPDNLETLYNSYTQTYSRDDEFSIYSTGFERVPPPDVRDLVKSPEDDAFKYFDDLTATRDKASEFQEYVTKEPQKAFKVFLRLLEKDDQFSQRYLRSLDWGLSSFHRKDDSSQEKTNEVRETEKQARLFPLLGIYEVLFALNTLHDPSQPLYSGTSFMNDEITWLADRDQARVLALFEKMWQRSKKTLAENTLSREKYFTQVLNQPLGKLVEGLLKLELHRARKHQQEDKLKEQKNTFTLLSETQRYLDDLIQIPNVEYTYSMLGAYLAFLFQVHQDWTEDHLIPLLSTLDKKEKEKGKALLEGLVGYGHFDVPLFSALRDSLRNLDFQAYFKAEDRNLFIRYANTMLSTYFVHPDTPTGLRRMTTVDMHAWLKEMPVENLTLVAKNLDTHFVMNEDFFNRKVMPFFKVGWPKEKAKHTAEQTAAFIELALEYPTYCQQISDVLREEGLIVRAEDGSHSRFLWRIKTEQLTPFDQANFTAFCNLLSDYLPYNPTQAGYSLEKLKDVLNEQNRLEVPPSLKNYLDRV